MAIHEIQAKSILRRHSKIDSWFISHCNMNLYRGCAHDCSYCDGRAEGYYVEGEFGSDVSVKINAIEILRRELDPRRKRTPFPKSFVLVGGGVGDSYQPTEEKYGLTRKTLQLLLERSFPVHMLTKSTMIKRDADLLRKINETGRAVASFSFSTVDDETARIFEPGVPPPGERLDAMRALKSEGIPCGMFLMPVIPHITDTKEMIEASVRAARDAGTVFVIFGGMTLKNGRQMEHFTKVLERIFPHLTTGYHELYKGDRWGMAAGAYYGIINKRFYEIAQRLGMPVRMPPSLYSDILSEKDLIIVALEHEEYMTGLRGQKSGLGFAAYSISQIDGPLPRDESVLRKMRGMTEKAMKIVLEVQRKTPGQIQTRLTG